MPDSFAGITMPEGDPGALAGVRQRTGVALGHGDTGE